jgi:UDP-2,3-diacylglucosamine hydrolase
MTMKPEGRTIADAHSGENPAANDSIALICGGGSLPRAVADAVVGRGRRAVMFAIKGWAEPKAVEQHPHHWIALGQFGRFLRLARAEQCRDVLFIGTLLRPPLSQIRLDWQTIRLMPRIAQSFRGGDDRLLSGMARLMEEEGLRVIGLKDVAPDVIVPEGVLGRCHPSPADRADIVRALNLLMTLGPFDVGQAAVVADNRVLALEAAEGTDNMLRRIAELRGQGRVTTLQGVGVLVKAPKPSQDQRFDLPAIGPQTIANVVNAGLAGVAVAAGNTIIADAADVIAAADRGKIFVVGVSQDPAA